MALPVLFMEKAECSLFDLINDSKRYTDTELSLGVRHQLSLDVLADLECLHTADIVHGDLKPANILVFKQQNSSVPFIAKLNDFGMCIPLEEESRLSYLSYGGIPGWLAPEVLEAKDRSQKPQEGKLLLKCDVFSFGLLVVSIFLTSAGPPFGLLRTAFSLSYIQEALRLVEGSYGHSKVSLLAATFLKKLIIATLDIDPKKRVDLDQSLLADDSSDYIAW